MMERPPASTAMQKLRLGQDVDRRISPPVDICGPGPADPVEQHHLSGAVPVTESFRKQTVDGDAESRLRAGQGLDVVGFTR
jgi:hypothetical protein